MASPGYRPRRRIGALLTAVVLAAAGASAQKPSARTAEQQQHVERTVFAAFPEADAYSSIVRPVKQSDRLRIEKQLPFKVHFNELGKHSLLVAFRGRRPVGLVYLRTEEAAWGLVDIAWHLTLDLRIVGFEFLRGRSRYCKGMPKSRLATRMKGRAFDAIVDQVKQHARADHRQRDDELVSLERTTLRSAAKSLIVTSTVWSGEIEKLHDQATGFDMFPASANFTRRTTTVDLEGDGNRRQVAVKVLYAYDVARTLQGCVAWTDSQVTMPAHDADTEDPADLRQRLRWTLDRDLRVLSVKPLTNHRDIELRKACTGMRGRSLRDPDVTHNPLDPLARSLGTVVVRLGKRRVRR